ncbi:MAG: hypothetical protein AAF799_12745 [Myxococcota bacterium]
MPVLSALALVTLVAAEPSALPLRKLRLYETGVGYFERRGNVGAGKGLALPLPATHLDDALKSLVILESSGGVKVRGIEFDSAVSEGMARAMAGLPSDDGEPVAYAELLQSLKGSKVELALTKGKVRGRLVDLEGPFFAPPPQKDGKATSESQGEPQYTLTVLDEDDALRRIKTDHVEAIRILDDRTAGRLDLAATTISQHSARQGAELEVQVGSAGRLGLGYITEAPVWRTTYRVVMGSEDEGQLQAWALIHNDTDEDWDSVMIELANGRPSSFMHPLANPLYAEREFVDVPDGLSTVPQTAPDVWGGLTGSAYGVGGLGLVGSGRGGGGTGEGTIGLGDIGTMGRAEGGSVVLGDLADLSQAEGTEAGALFLYRIADPIDLDAHHSALVPIVQQDFEVQPITLFPRDGGEALSAARLVNTTSQTLPPGAVSFFAEGGFVGESMFDRLKPHERRFIPYGYELDVELSRERSTVGEEVTVLRLHDQSIVESYVLESEITLSLDNRSGGTKRVYVELDVPRRAELRGDDGVELDYDLERSAPMAAVRVGARKTAVHTLRSKELLSRVHADLRLPTLVELRERDGVPQAQAKLLDSAIAKLRQGLRRDAEIAEAETIIGRTEADLARVRKHLSALGEAGGRSTARAKLSRELVEKEEQIEALREQIEAATDDAARVRKQARAALNRLNEWKPAATP